MKSIVTGGTGFIGKALVKNLLEKGWKVWVLTRTEGKAQKTFPEAEELLPGDPFPRAEVLFNLAGAVKGKTYHDFARANVEFIKNILEKSRGKVDKIVHLSSQAAGGPSPNCQPIKEDAENPVSLYGKSKLEGERLVKTFPGEWVVLRPPAVFGEEDYAFTDLYKLIKRGFAPWMGPRKFSVIYVKDLAYSLEVAVEKGKREVFNVASQEEVDYWDFVMEIADILGRKRVRKIPVPLSLAGAIARAAQAFSASMFTVDKIRELRYPCWILDVSRAEQRGILRRTPLRKALENTLAWARTQGII